MVITFRLANVPSMNGSEESEGSLTGRLPIRKHGNLAFLGYIQLTEIHSVFRSAVIGIIIGDPANRGQGYGQEALTLCIGFCWKELNLQRLSLMIAGSNEPAMRAYKKAGFEQEGVLKRAIFANGVYMNATIMGLVRSD